MDWHGGFLTIRRGLRKGVLSTTKSKKARRVDMSRQLQETLQALRDTRQEHAWTQGWTDIPASGWRATDPSARPPPYLCVPADSARRILSVCEGADGTPFHPSHRRYLRPPRARREPASGQPAGRPTGTQPGSNHPQPPRNRHRKPCFASRPIVSISKEKATLSLVSFVKGFNCLSTRPFHIMTMAVCHLFEKGRNSCRWVQRQRLLDFPRHPRLST